MTEYRSLYYEEMKKELESILMDKNNYYNYGGVNMLIENWEYERCRLMRTLMGRLNRYGFPSESMYGSAFRNALSKRMRLLNKE